MRDQIVDVMRSYGKPVSPTQLSNITGGALGSIAYHVRTLLAAGIVELSHEGRARGAVEHFYALAPDQTEVVLEDPARMLLALCGALTIPSDEGEFPLPVQLDDAGRDELDELVTRLRPQVQAIAAASTARVAG
jgi:DNA-binding transcriptional ArsR family regulator